MTDIAAVIEKLEDVCRELETEQFHSWNTARREHEIRGELWGIRRALACMNEAAISYQYPTSEGFKNMTPKERLGANAEDRLPHLSEAIEEAKASLDLNDPRLEQMAETERRTREALAAADRQADK